MTVMETLPDAAVRTMTVAEALLVEEGWRYSARTAAPAG